MKYINFNDIENNSCTKFNNNGYIDVDDLKTLPHIDIVHCNECKFCRTQVSMFDGMVTGWACLKHNFEFYNGDKDLMTGFCKWGEKNDDNNV